MYMFDAYRQTPGVGWVQSKGPAGEDTSGQIQRVSGLRGMRKKLDKGDFVSAHKGVECKDPHIAGVVVQCKQVEEMDPAAVALHELRMMHRLLEPC